MYFVIKEIFFLEKRTCNSRLHFARLQICRWHFQWSNIYLGWSPVPWEVCVLPSGRRTWYFSSTSKIAYIHIHSRSPWMLRNPGTPERERERERESYVSPIYTRGPLGPFMEVITRVTLNTTNPIESPRGTGALPPLPPAPSRPAKRSNYKLDRPNIRTHTQ